MTPDSPLPPTPVQPIDDREEWEQAMQSVERNAKAASERKRERDQKVKAMLQRLHDEKKAHHE